MEFSINLGDSCEPQPSTYAAQLPASFVEGFDGSLDHNWAAVHGGWAGRGCNSLAPFGTGKHLYFAGCGTRSAVTKVLDARRAAKVMFVLKIGGFDGNQGCSMDVSNSLNIVDKGVVLQYSINKGIVWKTINSHDPSEFRKVKNSFAALIIF